MSGHSKWHNIQARKGKQDARRSGQFTKFAKLITIAAQKGGDPEMNFSLRLAIEKAKAVSMPKNNIDRAIKHGTGEDGAGASMEEALYEAFGPGGVAILIKAVTDNKNRTIPDLKHILSEHSGSFGNAGSVQWMFHQWGMIMVEKDKMAKATLDPQEMELKLIDAGVEDMQDTNNGEIEIKTKTENFKKVLDVLQEAGVEVKESGIQWIAKDTIPISKEIEDKLGELFAALEDNDDVEDYFTNAA
ncbi:MAG: YebC/PmpR family DNA-binding transcriptional regulator [Candidatus Magasanikbacteria bacterium]|nr:YebC/PmpR family DNA-binding transcriptional regulator [Candidatus Magasanikbacteria bacterium]